MKIRRIPRYIFVNGVSWLLWWLRCKLWLFTMPQLAVMYCPFMRFRVEIWRKLGNIVGEQAYINKCCLLIDSPELKPNVILGDRVALSPYVTFITSAAPNDSRLRLEPSNQRYIRTAAIAIGEDTWIGTHTVIHPGVKIGKRCIIGAMSNVTHDIPDDSLAYGNPARVIRSLKAD